MRQIQFRGKVKYPEGYHGKRDIAEGEWVSGDLHLRCRFPHIHTDIFNSYPIDVDTIGQYTGLYDKNGREIYEGDILRKSTFVENDFTETYLDRDTIGVVRILPSCGTTICDCIVYETDDPYKEKKMKERIKRAQVVGKRCEVIGNIYDNPELLKGA